MAANIITNLSRALRTILCGAGLYAVVVALAFAIDDATLSIERAAGEGWSAQGISVHLDAANDPLRAAIEVAQIELPKLQLKLEHSRINCGTFVASSDAFVCNDAIVAMAIPELGDQHLRAQLRYDRARGAIKAILKNFKIGEGTANVTLRIEADRELMDTEVSHVSAPQLAKVANRFGFSLPLEITSGLVSGTVHAENRAQQLAKATANLTLEQFSVNNEEGSIATDKLSATIEGEVSASRDGFVFRGRVQSKAGQAYFDPIFLDTGVHALDAQAQGEWSSARGLMLDSFALRHTNVLTASGSGRIDFSAEQPVRDLKVSNARVLFPGAYETYLQGFIANDAMKSLRTNGAATVSAEVRDGAPQTFKLDIQTLRADGESLLRIDGLKANVTWSAQDLQRDVRGNESSLGWRAASLYGLEMGGAELHFQAGGHSFRLLEPSHVPVLDGALDVETLRIRNFAEPNVSFLVDATVQPISVPQLCRVFGWPEFGGHIGGAISKLRMRDGVITLGTTLNGQVFDGSVAVRDLRLEKPFSNWPRFYANVAFGDLDLEQVTSAFSFGRITGKLSGTLNGLELFNWSPVAFDAHFFTPPNDRSKHRISQRAVQSIGSLGGGGSSIAAALSSGFLRFFSDFNYDRIGLSCRLENDVCLMDGVAPAPGGGYYLVKGRGVPRIDVIGNSRRVDWPRLLQQLEAATEADNVVVK